MLKITVGTNCKYHSVTDDEQLIEIEIIHYATFGPVHWANYVSGEGLSVKTCFLSILHEAYENRENSKADHHSVQGFFLQVVKGLKTWIIF